MGTSILRMYESRLTRRNAELLRKEVNHGWVGSLLWAYSWKLAKSAEVKWSKELTEWRPSSTRSTTNAMA
ncbi:hypothetical protein Y032_0323g2496 [Ancylostoma ceylanicum]|uniref:Uncharacterized protein n=1 Tax=Ancylostoma ceylanicum TaxID=53326 RepID=A0A016S1J2_9BILA|nr:hypothetical protein Y032_0323g2496 [Ancylostoma ceylanicum]